MLKKLMGFFYPLLGKSQTPDGVRKVCARKVCAYLSAPKLAQRGSIRCADTWSKNFGQAFWPDRHSRPRDLKQLKCGSTDVLKASWVDPACAVSGIVLCDAAASRIRIRIARCQRPAKCQKHKPCETQGRVFPPFLLVGSEESVLKVPKRGEFHAAACDSCNNLTLRFVCPRNL